MSEKPPTHLVQKVTAQIKRAFAEVHAPTPDNIALCPCAECKGVRSSLKTDPGARWSEVPEETIVANYDKLPLLTTEAFHFYLPAYMVYALKTWESSDVWDFTLYGLTRHKKESASQAEWRRDRFRLFTRQQMQSICAFLDLFLIDSQDWYMWTLADQGKKQFMEYMALQRD